MALPPFSTSAVSLSPPARHIAFLLIERFSMMAFFSAVEPLRIANRIAEHSLYRWTVLSVDGHPVTASNDMRLMADGTPEDIDTPHALAICAGFTPLNLPTRALYRRLHHFDQQGCRLGGIDTGAFVLATAGLIDPKDRVTLHWESLPDFRERWPHLQTSEALFELGRNRFFCAGGAAAMDMSLAAIAQHHGQDLANAVAEQLIHDRVRGREDHQRLSIARRLNLHQRPLIETLHLMEQHLEKPIPIETLAQKASVSRRQLQRLFSEQLGSTPAAWYLSLRLHRARALLEESEMSITAIALACGFTSASGLGHAFQRHYGHAPGHYRRSNTDADTP
ncbi:GlxA family transcriptional regulator [Kushneria indalinina]|uniref:AraC family transcriptional regulator with amidase-like domain n=1 Tax=Kushneria indalinina DSM 14324 TaxID=1122140 RepID=A0A3D9DU59_9GAMM|nr:GlxA family transcriptional regulator [Kushneria indalinina]REC94308.1 AraC family transcriptional regulator with amidase-like domain [Kushneria indalinina DSM 14324]